MVREEIEGKYSDVQSVLGDALKKANSISISGSEENDELIAIRKTLETLNVSFKQEIDQLKKNSEWDKFCIAFFGETNAGKSTIIESLRIIYDEETRRAEALAQEREYISILKKHCADYEDLISTLEKVDLAVQIAMKKYRKYKFRWLFYIVFGIAGIVSGAILANLGVLAW